MCETFILIIRMNHQRVKGETRGYGLGVEL